MLDEYAKIWYRTKCELELHKNLGNAYQDFFARVMQMRHGADFSQVRPWGNLGDRKCDGYLKSKKMLFQVYAPNEMKPKLMQDKIDEDLRGAEDYWDRHIDYWAFVHNSHSGLSGDIEKKLANLRADKPGRNLLQYGPDWLLTEVMALDFASLTELFGPPLSSQSMSQVRATNIAELLRRIYAEQQTLPTQLAVVPANKMDFNNFEEAVRYFLKVGRQKEKAVEDILNGWADPTYPDRMASGFRRQYSELKNQGLTADEIYHSLTKFAGVDLVDDIRQVAAAYALLSYLFYNCDIFESQSQ